MARSCGKAERPRPTNDGRGLLPANDGVRGIFATNWRTCKRLSNRPTAALARRCSLLTRGLPNNGPRMSPLRKPRAIWSPSRTASKQLQVFAPRRIETGVTTTVDDLGLGELSQFLVGRSRIIDHRQGIQVAAVAGHRLLLIVDQGSHAFGHLDSSPPMKCRRGATSCDRPRILAGC